MKKILLALLLPLLVLPGATPAKADVNFVVGADFGPGPHHHRPYESYRHGYGPYPRHAYAPPVFYAPPPVIVEQPATVYVSQPVTVVRSSVVNVDPSAPTFLDNFGRTCRAYQTTIYLSTGPAATSGKACLFTDGTWRSVE